MIDFRQIRAARALLNWSQADLARAAKLATSSVKAIECEAASARRETLAQISAAFDRHGIEFLPQAGVRLKNETLVVLDGRDCVAKLFETIEAETFPHRVREVLVLGLDMGLAAETDGVALYRRHPLALDCHGHRVRQFRRHAHRIAQAPRNRRHRRGPVADRASGQ